MAFTSARPITVDGVRLDTLAWNIEKIERATAARRSGDYDIPNLDGAVASLNDPLEPSRFGLQMWLRGTDESGAVPAGVESLTEFRENLDELLHLFGKRHALLEVVEQTGPGVDATNVAMNPVPRINLTWWTSSATLTRVQDGGIWRVSVPASATYAYATATGVVGKFYAARLRVKGTPGATYGVVSTDNVVGGWAAPVDGVTQRTIPASGEEVLELKSTAAVGGTGLNYGITGPSAVTLITEAQVEEVSGPGGRMASTSFWDGASAADATYTYAWTGTANASASTRTAKAKRRALAKVTDSIQPEVESAGSVGRFAVSMVIPSGQWEDLTTQDWVSVAGLASGTSYEVTTLQGSTERVNDGIFLVMGPATTPRITDPATGMYVELGFDLPAATAWRFNSGTWTSRTGAAVTLVSSEVTGTDRTNVTMVGGPSRAYGLPLVPVRDTGLRRVKVALSAAGGMTAATQLTIRARRKFAA